MHRHLTFPVIRAHNLDPIMSGAVFVNIIELSLSGNCTLKYAVCRADKQHSERIIYNNHGVEIRAGVSRRETRFLSAVDK